MTIFYVLEVSKAKPTVFRISVVRSMDDVDATNATSEGFNLISMYRTADDLTMALEPYLNMEEGK